MPKGKYTEEVINDLNKTYETTNVEIYEINS